MRSSPSAPPSSAIEARRQARDSPDLVRAQVRQIGEHEIDRTTKP